MKRIVLSWNEANRLFTQLSFIKLQLGRDRKTIRRSREGDKAELKK